jgi:hypothetical protein
MKWQRKFNLCLQGIIAQRRAAIYKERNKKLKNVRMLINSKLRKYFKNSANG